MKRFLLAALLVFPALAAADYDGVWEVTFPGYNADFATINTNDSWVIVALVNPTDNSWEAYEGPISGNTATLGSIYPAGGIFIKINFVSATQAFITLERCEVECAYPVDTAFQAVKIH